MILSKKAYPLSRTTWTRQGHEIEFEGRSVSTLVIGTEQTNGGKEVYITEQIYSDLIEYLFNKFYTVHIDLYSYPQIVMEKNSMLVMHSPEIEKAKDLVVDALSNENEIFPQNQIKALADIRNNLYGRTKTMRSTKVLRDVVSKKLNLPKGVRVNYDLLRICLFEKYTRKEENKYGINKMSKEDLAMLFAGLVEYRETKKSTFDPLSRLLEAGGDAKEINALLKHEISVRFFEGRLS